MYKTSAYEALPPATAECLPQAERLQSGLRFGTIDLSPMSPQLHVQAERGYARPLLMSEVAYAIGMQMKSGMLMLGRHVPGGAPNQAPAGDLEVRWQRGQCLQLRAGALPSPRSQPAWPPDPPASHPAQA